MGRDSTGSQASLKRPCPVCLGGSWGDSREIKRVDSRALLDATVDWWMPLWSEMTGGSVYEWYSQLPGGKFQDDLWKKLQGSHEVQETLADALAVVFRVVCGWPYTEVARIVYRERGDSRSLNKVGSRKIKRL